MLYLVNKRKDWIGFKLSIVQLQLSVLKRPLSITRYNISSTDTYAIQHKQ